MDINATFAPSASKPSGSSFDTLYYYRHVSPEQIQQVLQAHSEGTSLRAISRVSGLAYNMVVSIVRPSSVKAQLVHNDSVEQVETEKVSADAPVVICAKKTKAMSPR